MRCQIIRAVSNNYLCCCYSLTCFDFVEHFVVTSSSGSARLSYELNVGLPF